MRPSPWDAHGPDIDHPVPDDRQDFGPGFPLRHFPCRALLRSRFGVMTFSIVAGGGTAYGVAVASKFLAVGSVVPAAVPGIGAVATQSFAKVSYKADSLALLRA